MVSMKGPAMILWLSIFLVVGGSLLIAIFVCRQWHGLDFGTRVTTILALLGLFLGCGIGAQQYLDQQRDGQVSSRQNAMSLALTDTLAHIYGELIRTDLTPQEKRARIRPLVERYNRIRTALAQTNGGSAPPPLLTLDNPDTNSANAAADAPPATGTDEPAQAPETGVNRRTPSPTAEEEDVPPASFPPPAASTPPPPPPPPPM